MFTSIGKRKKEKKKLPFRDILTGKSVVSDFILAELYDTFTHDKMVFSLLTCSVVRSILFNIDSLFWLSFRAKKEQYPHLGDGPYGYILPLTRTPIEDWGGLVGWNLSQLVMWKVIQIVSGKEKKILIFSVSVSFLPSLRLFERKRYGKVVCFGKNTPEVFIVKSFFTVVSLVTQSGIFSKSFSTKVT